MKEIIFDPCFQFWDWDRDTTRGKLYNNTLNTGQPYGYVVDGNRSAVITSQDPNIKCAFRLTDKNSPASGNRPRPGENIASDLAWQISTPVKVTVRGYRNKVLVATEPVEANLATGQAKRVRLSNVDEVTFEANASNVAAARCEFNTNNLFRYCISIDQLTTQPFYINTVSLPAATVGAPYSQPLTVSNGTPPYALAVDSGSQLPPGLSLTTSNTGGVISGVPTTAGSFRFTLVITDGQGNKASQEYILECRLISIIGTSVFRTITPGRIYDSRPTKPDNVRGGEGPVTAGLGRFIRATGGIVPSSADAVLVNVTVTDAVGGGYVTVFPTNQADSPTASVNWYQGGARTVTTFAIVKLDTNGDFKLKGGGTANVIIDVLGYAKASSLSK